MMESEKRAGAERAAAKGGQASLRSDTSFEHLSASALQKYLRGMRYPADRQALIRHAESRSAPPAVIQALEKFRTEEYRNAAEVSREFGRIK